MVGLDRPASLALPCRWCMEEKQRLFIGVCGISLRLKFISFMVFGVFEELGTLLFGLETHSLPKHGAWSCAHSLFGSDQGADWRTDSDFFEPLVMRVRVLSPPCLLLL